MSPISAREGNTNFPARIFIVLCFALTEIMPIFVKLLWLVTEMKIFNLTKLAFIIVPTPHFPPLWTFSTTFQIFKCVFWKPMYIWKWTKDSNFSPHTQDPVSNLNANMIPFPSEAPKLCVFSAKEFEHYEDDSRWRDWHWSEQFAIISPERKFHPLSILNDLDLKLCAKGV